MCGIRPRSARVVTAERTAGFRGPRSASQAAPGHASGASPRSEIWLAMPHSARERDALRPSPAPLKYRGVNRLGAGIVGRGQIGQSAADLAQEFFERGFRKLTLTDADGTEVGGITATRSGRTWWGDNRAK